MIRQYKNEDYSRVLQILSLNTPAYFHPSEQQDLQNYLKNEVEYYYVFEEEDIIKGCGGLNKNQENSYSISWDLVDPNYKGAGIGSRLLRFRLDLLKNELYASKVIVRTSQMAHSFYQQFGFIVKKVEKDYWAPGYDLYFMEFTL